MSRVFMGIPGELFKAVQEHIDNNYIGGEGDGIDWISARRDALDALGERYGEDSVNRAVDKYMN